MSHQPHEVHEALLRQRSGAPHEEVPPLVTEVHADPYAEELGPGVPLYDAWIIEDDEASGGIDSTLEDHKKGFKTPRGYPSSNELWRFRGRGCQDCWAALFFAAAVTAGLLGGIAGVLWLELTEDMVATIADNVGADRGDAEMLTRHLTRVVAVAGGDAGKVGGTVRVVKGFPALQAGAEILWLASTPAGVDPRSTPTGGSLVASALLLAAAAVLALAGAMLGLVVLVAFPGALIMMNCYVLSALAASVGFMLLFSGVWGFAVLFCFGIAAVPLLWLYLMQERIPFSASLLRTASTLVRRHSGLVVLSLFFVVLLGLHTAVTLLFLMAPMLRGLAYQPLWSDTIYTVLALGTLVWVQQVLINVMHVTTSGVAATWYFASDRYMPPSPIRASFTRAMSSSFGSICLGSLAVTLVRLLRQLFNASNASDEDGGGLLSCIESCILTYLDLLLEYFNNYAFVHVAVYGCGYTDAARRTLRLTRQCFFAAVFNDCLVDQAIGALTLIVVVLVGVFAVTVTWSSGFALLAMAATLFVCEAVYQAVRSTVTTIFVCFAELPEGLRISFPELYVELMHRDAGFTTVHGNTYGAAAGAV